MKLDWEFFRLNRRSFLKLAGATVLWLQSAQSSLFGRLLATPAKSGLARPLSKWPLLLCGPMLRRVTNDRVSVWVALKNAQHVTLRVYAIEGSYNGDGAGTDGRPSPAMRGSQETIQFAKNLHIACVTAVSAAGNPSLAPGVLYCYDLEFTASGVEGTNEYTNNLNAAKLLKDATEEDIERLALGYQPGWLPRFSLPPSDATKLRIFHGSCRKPHAPGDDALAILDQEIEKWTSLEFTPATQAEVRPHQLFLTGDQIYADDVAPTLLHQLTDTGYNLLGWEETFPGGRLTIRPVANYPNPGEIKLNLLPSRRQRLINAAGLTSSAAASHLIGWGEFMAMYLFAWSQELWNATQPGLRDILGFDPDAIDAENASKQENFREGHQINMDQYGELIKSLRESLTEDGIDQHLAKYHQLLPRVRRALANVPTYMMFDDHEITDDWYLNRSIAEVALDPSNEFARRLMTNGLMAFAIFQAWGNTPERFEGGPGQELFSTIKKWSEKREASDIKSITKLVGIYDWGSTPPGRAERVAFDFGYTWSAHRAIVLDTRTWRDFTNPDRAALISTAGIVCQLEQVDPQSDDKLTFLISPAPVLGVPLVESVIQEGTDELLKSKRELIDTVDEFGQVLESIPQISHDFWGNKLQKMARKLRAAKRFATDLPFEFDLEAWSGNNLAFQQLLRCLHRWPRVIILSGDVHYASTVQCDFWEERGLSLPACQTIGASPYTTTPGSSVYVQVTSSACKNQETKTRAVHTLGYTSPLFDVRKFEVFNWTNPQKNLKVRRRDPSKNEDFFARTLPILRPFLPPYLRTIECDPCPAQPASVYALTELVVNQLVDWVYRIHLQRVVSTPNIPQEIRDSLRKIREGWESRPLKEKFSIYSEIGKQVKGLERLVGGRDCVGYNNIGEITFNQTGSELELIHSLWWKPNDEDALYRLTQHRVSLALPAPASKPAITVE